MSTGVINFDELQNDKVLELFLLSLRRSPRRPTARRECMFMRALSAALEQEKAWRAIEFPPCMSAVVSWLQDSGGKQRRRTEEQLVLEELEGAGNQELSTYA